MPDQSFVTLVDYDKEKTTILVNVAEIDGTNLSAMETLMNTFVTKLAAITMGAEAQRGYTARELKPWVKPTDANCQRESKWLVTYRDVTPVFEVGAEIFENPAYLRVYTMEIGTALKTSTLLNEDGKWIKTATAWTEFKAAFEALAVSPGGGEVEMLEVIHVGRNL